MGEALPKRFVGRAAELARMRAAHEGGQRLTVLWGPGGAGKTQIARAFAEERRAAGDDVLEVDLAGAQDAEAIAAEVQKALGITRAHAGELGPALASRGAVLLVLEHLERVLDAAAKTIAGWLRAAPAAQLLVTSRERLRLAEELTIEIGPLSLPEGDKLEGSEAVEMFVERVRARKPDFKATDENAALILELTRRLEGWPLAIELCAARVDVLGLERTTARLRSPLSALGADLRGGEARHLTLRSTIAWSWDLLEEVERRALAECAVFRGGFDLDAAEAVVEADDVLEVIERLRDKSLLATKAQSVEGVRFHLYEPVREFAEERLVELGLADGARTRHRDHFLTLAKRYAGAPETVPEPAISALSPEVPNLVEVLDRALRAGHAEAALTAALAIDRVLSTRGPLGELIALFDRVLGEADGAPSPLVVQAKQARGRARGLAGDNVRAERELREARAEAKDPRLEGSILIDLGVHLHKLRRTNEAREAYEAADRIFAERDAPRSLARLRGNLGALAHDELALDEARDRYEQALTLARRAGDSRLEGVFRGNLGVLEHERGRIGDAADHLERSVRCLKQVGDRRLEAISLGNLGALFLEKGQPEEAKDRHRRAIRLLREVGDRRSEALALARLSAAEASLEHASDARANLEAAEDLARSIGDPMLVETVELYRGFLDLARIAAGADPAETSLAERIARVKAPKDGSSLVDRSDDVRLALRILERTPAKAAAPVETAIPEDAVVIGPEAQWFRGPRGEWQDFRRRLAPRRLVFALADLRKQHPGKALTTEQLFEAGWPGEKIQSDSAQNRVWVALATVRKLGLKDVILSRADGYLFDPAVPLRETTQSFEALTQG